LRRRRECGRIADHEITGANMTHAMSGNSGKRLWKSTRSASSSTRVQVKNPVTNRWVKIDTTNGRIVDTKKSPGPYKGVPKK
jgi:hypothetical protein